MRSQSQLGPSHRAKLHGVSAATLTTAPANMVRHHVVNLDMPIACRRIVVFTGDIIVGDGEGVVLVPSHPANEIAEEAHEKMAAFEDVVTGRVLDGKTIAGLYPSTDEHNIQIFADWRKRNDS